MVSLLVGYINAYNYYMFFALGAVSKAIAKAGGKQLTDECAKLSEYLHPLKLYTILKPCTMCKFVCKEMCELCIEYLAYQRHKHYARIYFVSDYAILSR